MPLDPRFYRAVEPLYFSGMGTEHVAPLLYTLARMTRPRSVLEVGLGYTTPFLAQALQDNVAEFESDRRILAAPGADEERQLLLVRIIMPKSTIPSCTRSTTSPMKARAGPTRSK